MARNIKKEAKLTRDIGYLNKDFTGFRKDLLNYAKTHFSDNIKDFSEVSVGGMLVDMAAYVGDVMSFYLDHQFNELNLETAIEDANVERLIRQAGVRPTGASPASVLTTIYMRVDSAYNRTLDKYEPAQNQLPILQQGTKLSTPDGKVFELIQDYDLAERAVDGNYLIITSDFGNVDKETGNPLDFIISAKCIFTSAITKTETFTISNEFVPFRTLSLGESDISEIISVLDRDGNEYHEVKTLSHDIVFKRYKNTTTDRQVATDKLKLIPAPRRFRSDYNIVTGKTTITFGSGRSDTYEDDIIQDPSDHALPLYGNKKTFSRFSLDPNKLLETRSLGVSPINTTLTISYRYSGGYSHNIGAGQLTSVVTLITKFNSAIGGQKIRQLRSTFEAYNEQEGFGGTDRPTLDDLRNVALNYKGSQDRIVTKQDLITRVYTMPSRFGRVFRVAIAKNNYSSHTAFLRILSKDKDGYLSYSGDTLKDNIARYINEYRLIGDSIDILDGKIINFGVKFTITVQNTHNENNVLVRVINKLKKFLKVDNFQIDQPINLTELQLLITSTDGVNALVGLDLTGIHGTHKGRDYIGLRYNLRRNTRKGIVYPASGGMFELKYPDDDIVGRVI